MAPTLLLMLLQALAVIATPNFLAALEFHQKRQTPEQAYSACSAVSGVIEVCKSGVPGFLTLAPAVQAGCACYYGDATTTKWIPDFFDGAIETCASAARTLDPNLYTALQSFDNLCAKAGDVRAAPAIPPACSTVIYAVGVCNSAIPGLSTLGARSSAACLCYDSTTWLPNRFDAAVQTCAAFLQTASPSDYQALKPLSGFCSTVGDVLKPANVPATTTQSVIRPPTTTAPIFNPNVTPGISTTRAPVGGATFITFPACSAVGSAISSCERVSPGFTTAPTSSQAACICYTRSTSWVPDRFDSPVSSCADFVKTASPENYSLFDNLRGFCSFVGDVYATAVTTTTSLTTSRTTTTPVANPGPATPSSSSRANAAPTLAVDRLALKVISVVVIIQALA